MTELGKLLDEAKASQQAAMGDKLVKYEALSQVDLVSTAHMKRLAESTALAAHCDTQHMTVLLPASQGATLNLPFWF